MDKIFGKKVPMMYFLELVLLFSFSGYQYSAQCCTSQKASKDADIYAKNDICQRYMPKTNHTTSILSPIIRNPIQRNEVPDPDADCQWFEIGLMDTLSLRNFISKILFPNIISKI